MSTEPLEQFKIEYQTGKNAFERGQYREAVQFLAKASQLVDRNSRLGGETLMWLVTAYQGAGQSSEAIALCRTLIRHPSIETRKQAKRLIYILEAPELRSRPEWKVEIPDMSELDEGTSKVAQVSMTTTAKQPKRKSPDSELPFEDLSQINTQDNGFVWVAMVAIALLVGGLLWFS
ncbi:tetratricopeptide repeat protein [Laspinema olomoucense]|uniref:tetratricopeptide repeat protein n=1 Tax=Laspinema olomoucense TaxID=3231600 RepID=UPI0021BBA70D|nr:tetratricopeptide repeat protein [Laspinema sp. D3a]MCT7987031.1 tetratricopeptide repeat protein [Laspinema sp. D3a]